MNRAFRARAFWGDANPGAMPQAERERRAFRANQHINLAARIYTEKAEAKNFPGDWLGRARLRDIRSEKFAREFIREMETGARRRAICCWGATAEPDEVEIENKNQAALPCQAAFNFRRAPVVGEIIIGTARAR